GMRLLLARRETPVARRTRECPNVAFQSVAAAGSAADVADAPALLKRRPRRPSRAWKRSVWVMIFALRPRAPAASRNKTRNARVSTGARIERARRSRFAVYVAAARR